MMLPGNTDSNCDNNEINDIDKKNIEKDDHTDKDDTGKDNAISEMELNNLDRLADFIFTVGIYYALTETDTAERLIVLGQEQKLSKEEESALRFDVARLLAQANWFYFTAGTILLGTSSERLESEKASISGEASEASKERLAGREMVVAGNIFKSIGFLLSANGFEMIADSIQKDTDS